MKRRALLSPVLLSLLGLAACKGRSGEPGSSGIEPEAPAPVILTVPGWGPMKCTPIGSARPAISALPLDLPKAAGSDATQLFAVEINADGGTFIDGKRIDDEGAVVALARGAIQNNPDVRAVIRADAAVPHGQVIRTLDLLKQAGISKIGFGVVPVPPGTGTGP